MTRKQLEMNSQLFGLLQKICTSEALMEKGIKALQDVLKNKEHPTTGTGHPEPLKGQP